MFTIRTIDFVGDFSDFSTVSCVLCVPWMFVWFVWPPVGEHEFSLFRFSFVLLKISIYIVDVIRGNDAWGAAIRHTRIGFSEVNLCDGVRK